MLFRSWRWWGTGTAAATGQAVQSEWVAAGMDRQVQDQGGQDWADRGGKGLMGTGARAQHCSAGVVGVVVGTADKVVVGSAGTVASARGARWDGSRPGGTGEQRTW